MKIITDAQCINYSSEGHPEKPARVARTVEKLREQNELTLKWARPVAADDRAILRAHTVGHVSRLSKPKDFDADTPAYHGIVDYARMSAGAAQLAMLSARAGETVFSLMRPPGHHATRSRAMGFCYLNNVAIAALEAMADGVKRVAVYDFDVHHGNGTEDILLNRHGTAFFSVHQFPAYPGTGSTSVGDNCFNYPVPPGTPRQEYRRVLALALDALKRFRPELVAVSAGFDAYTRDPLADGTLEAEDFHWLGQSLRGLGIPMFSVLEGGYSKDLPDLIFAYLKGIAGK